MKTGYPTQEQMKRLMSVMLSVAREVTINFDSASLVEQSQDMALITIIEQTYSKGGKTCQ